MTILNSDTSIIESTQEDDNSNTGLSVKAENHNNFLNPRHKDEEKLEKEFSGMAGLNKYQRLIKGDVPDDIIYRLILQGDKTGELEIDSEDITVEPFHRFAYLWVDACLKAQEDNHWTDATPIRSFIDICLEEIKYNSRTGEFEWKFYDKPLNFNFLLLEVKTMLNSFNSDSCPLYKAEVLSKDDAKILAEQIINKNQYNPISKWAESLPEWDENDRYKELLGVLGQDADNQVSWLFFEWMKAAMNRFLVPGSVNELVPILKGKQGCRKTSFCLNLCDYTGTLDSITNSAENIRIKHKLAIGELGEFNGMLSVKAVEAIKREISRTYDPLRPLYTNTTIDLPRAFSYIATINTENFFTDTTGNRRFFVIEIPRSHKIDIDWVSKNIEQLWAQIKQDDSLKGWLNDEQEKIAAIGNKDFTRHDTASEFVEWFSNKFPLEQLKEGILTFDDHDNHALRTEGVYLTKDRLNSIASSYIFDTYGNHDEADKQFLKNVEYILTGKGFSYKQHRLKRDAHNGSTGNRLRYYRFEGEEII